jgi:DNA-directed RNA polymerase specialized sigma24 family protein
MNSSALLALSSVLLVLRVEAFRAWRSLSRFGYESEDLRQEFALRLLQTHASYEPLRSSTATFTSRVCRSRSLQLVEAASCGKRGGGIVPRSLSDPLKVRDHADSAEVSELADTISEDGVASRTGRRSRSALEVMALRLDVERVVRELPTELANVAELLAAGVPVVAVARMLGVSRATVNRRITALREVFRAAGLDGYMAREAA